MGPSDVGRAVAAAMSTASALGLAVDDAVVINNSDRIVVRLTPCDVLARVAPSAHRDGSQFELEVVLRLAVTDAPVGELEPRVEPRVYEQDGFVITLWTYYESVASSDLVPSAAGRLMRSADEACEHYPGANQDVVEQSRILIWAMITTWRWRRHDQLPNGRNWGVEGLKQLRTELDP